ncbi:MAG TPA: hypothetical protein VGY66_23540 [Gemmataceae bacterium]|jgi:hypothetical protein|nr:hypothetical protein [Gemmataceae bacterium]
MTCLVFALAALAVLPLNSRAEETNLTVRPMAAPKPALKYQLLPELAELNPGNAAQNYLKCFMEQRNFFFSKEAVADRARYQTMPLAELPVNKLRDYGGYALRQADWAARLDTLDWQNLQRIQHGGLGMLQEELGPLQVLVAALRVRFRAEVAERHFDDAIRTAKTLFALSRHLGEHPTEVANLVGLWSAHVSLLTLEEMVQQPGCPNLYWALTDLPCPLVDLRKGVQGERMLMAAELRPLCEGAPMTEAELEGFVSRLSGVLSFAREQAGRPPRSIRNVLQARAKDPENVRAARCRLIEAGCAENRLKQFPPLQIILLDEKHQYEVQRDERMKLLNLPAWQIESMAGSEERVSREDRLLADLLPHMIKLRMAQAQLEQQVAVLRLVEALRLYAAEHEGKLPAKLSDMPVPLPPDPVTGKPFPYTVDGATARINGSSKASADRAVHYSITIRN